MGKASLQERKRSLQENQRYQGNISCTINEINSKDLTEAEEIKKRWQEYTELYKKGLKDPDNHEGVVTHQESDILTCEVKWALESITVNKASGGDGVPAELFKILKDDAVQLFKCYKYESD